VSDALAASQEARRAGYLVRRVRADIPGARSSGAFVDLEPARLSTPDEGGMSSSRTDSESIRAWTRRRTSPTDGSPVPQPARDVIPPGQAPCLCGEPRETTDQIAEALLERHGTCTQFIGRSGTRRCPSGEPRVERSARLA